MDFKQLQSFVTVARCGSFTQAAQKLFISQPTVSAHVRTLEEELGRKLLIRTTKAIEITPKGREICEYAEGILNMRDRILNACSEAQQYIIHLGASTIPAAYILPQLLSGFAKQQPNVYFSLQQSSGAEILEGIHDGMFELGMLSRYDETLNCIPMCRDRMVLITPVSQRYLDMKNARRTPLDSLADEPLILRESDEADKQSNRFLGRMGILSSQLHAVARINDQEAVKNLVAGGMGISFISEMAAHDYIEEKRVISFELQSDDGRLIYLVHKKSVELPPHIKQFISYVESVCVRKNAY